MWTTWVVTGSVDPSYLMVTSAPKWEVSLWACSCTIAAAARFTFLRAWWYYWRSCRLQQAASNTPTVTIGQLRFSAVLYMGPRVCGVHVIASSTTAHAVCTSTVTIRQLRFSAVLHILILLIYIWLRGFVGPTCQQVVLLHIQYCRGPSYLSKIYSSERGREINGYIVY